MSEVPDRWILTYATGVAGGLNRRLLTGSFGGVSMSPWWKRWRPTIW
jgi:hypothetical protein